MRVGYSFKEVQRWFDNQNDDKEFYRISNNPKEDSDGQENGVGACGCAGIRSEEVPGDC